MESLLLGVLGGVCGLLLSIWGVRAFVLSLPANLGIPYWMDFAIDYTVVGYLALICIATSVLFGLAPALQVSKVDLNRSLKEGSRGSGGGRARYLSRTLVVGELAAPSGYRSASACRSSTVMVRRSTSARPETDDVSIGYFSRGMRATAP